MSIRIFTGMHKRVVLLGILVVISLFLGGCAAIHVRNGHPYKDKYPPPYQGVKYCSYSMQFRGGWAYAIDLPLTAVVDTCLLPWDLVAIAPSDSESSDRDSKIYTVQCQECGCFFFSKHNDQKYCSAKCLESTNNSK